MCDPIFWFNEHCGRCEGDTHIDINHLQDQPRGVFVQSKNCRLRFFLFNLLKATISRPASFFFLLVGGAILKCKQS